MKCDGCENVRTCLDAGPLLPHKASFAPKAYQVDLLGISSIVLEDTAGKAKMAVFRGAKETGFNPVFKGLRVKRAPEYDGAYSSVGIPAAKGLCYIPGHLMCAAGKSVKPRE